MLYDGPYVLNEVAGQPGDEVWSIEVDGFVPHLDQVQRVLTPDMQGEPAQGETLATVDESLGLGRLTRNGAAAAEGDWDRCGGGCSRRSRSRRSASAARRSSLRSLTSPSASSSARRSAPTRRSRIRSSTATSLSSSRGRSPTGRPGRSPRTTGRSTSRSRRRSRRRPRPPSLACEKSIQAHGGIGFTWEHPLHRYYKRALWLEGALGYGREHRAEIAAILLLSAS